MQKLTLIIIASFMLFTFIMLAPNTHAELQGNPWVATYDTNDNPETQFGLGETVRIKAYSHVTPYYIRVYEPDATLKMTIGPINTTDYSGDYDNITTTEGWWTLFILDTSAHYGIGQYFVIPMTPLGVAAALSACFASLGVRRLRTKK